MCIRDRPQAGRCSGGAFNRAGLQRTPRGAVQLDLAAVGGSAGQVGGGGIDQPGMCAGDLKKNELKPWLQKQWGIPPQANADFVCAMEDVL